LRHSLHGDNYGYEEYNFRKIRKTLTGDKKTFREMKTVLQEMGKTLRGESIN
jgi:hypothetical protein